MLPEPILEQQLLDRGPWEVNGAAVQSDDFTFDATLSLSGNFADESERRVYLQHLATVLTRGCALQSALALEPQGGLLHALEQAAESSQRPLLQQAAEEIALLREQLSNVTHAAKLPAFVRAGAEQALEGGSAFADALRQALQGSRKA